MATSDFSVNGSSDEAANVQNSQPPHPEAIELNRDLNSVGARCPQHRPGTILNPVAFKALADCSDELWIELEGQLYRLRKTKQGKLILTK